MTVGGRLHEVVGLFALADAVVGFALPVAVEFGLFRFATPQAGGGDVGTSGLETGTGPAAGRGEGSEEIRLLEVAAGLQSPDLGPDLAEVGSVLEASAVEVL